MENEIFGSFASQIITVVATAIFGVIICTAAYGTYNAFFHPLSKYPGPTLWTAFKLPYVISVVRGELHLKVLEFHQKYGEVVRISPDELSFTVSSAWDDIQGLLPDRRQNRKDLHWYGPLEAGWERQIVVAPDTNHARLRRIFGPAFTPKAVDELSGMLLKYSNRFIECLTKAIETKAVQDMSAWDNFATFDLMGEFAFDESFQCLENAGSSFVTTIVEGAPIGSSIGQLERYGIWSMIKPLLPKSAFKVRDEMNQYVADLTRRRSERGFIPGKKDVFNYLLQNKNEEDRLDHDELAQNSIILVVAGSETTATLLTGIMWQLCKNEAAYRKVVNEIRSAFTNESAISPKAVSSLPYVQAVISETMRLVPPVPNGFPRFIVTPGGQMIAGHHVPEKMQTSVSQYAAYRYERNFHRAEEFIPERWLKDKPEEFKNDARNVLQPFHVGPRGCIGKNLADAEMNLLLAKFLWHFDFELAEPEKDWFGNLKTVSIWVRKPLMIRLTLVHR